MEVLRNRGTIDLSKAFIDVGFSSAERSSAIGANSTRFKEQDVQRGPPPGRRGVDILVSNIDA